MSTQSACYVKGNDGAIPLHVAAALGNPNVARVFVKELGAAVDEIDNDGSTPLHLAAANGYTETVRVLVQELGAMSHMVNNSGNMPLLLATSKKELRTAIAVKSHGSTPPLHCAAANGHLQTVRVLVQELGADVNLKNNVGNTTWTWKITKVTPHKNWQTPPTKPRQLSWCRGR